MSPAPTVLLANSENATARSAVFWHTSGPLWPSSSAWRRRWRPASTVNEGPSNYAQQVGYRSRS